METGLLLNDRGIIDGLTAWRNASDVTIPTKQVAGISDKDFHGRHTVTTPKFKSGFPDLIAI